MEYFNFIEDKGSIFYKAPEGFGLHSDKRIISHALGATLYMGGDRKNLLNDVFSNHACSVVICLEDSVAASLLEDAETNVLSFFKQIGNRLLEDSSFIEKLPLIFLRPRSYEQFQWLLSKLDTSGLCGFVFPKFSSKNGEKYLETLKKYNANNSRQLYGMPILETPEVIFKETRVEELLKLKELLDSYKDMILNIRTGGTDLSGLYGLRRRKDTTIYELAIIKDFIADVINIFKRDGYVISGAVFEHYGIPYDLDSCGLVRETRQDMVNGFTGKTVIHPKQVDLINSLFVISREEYSDAQAIASSSLDGVIKSSYSNKMNEVKPHLKWAHNILLLSSIMGVFNDGKSYKDIINY